jgi:hypothetical protein
MQNMESQLNSIQNTISVEKPKRKVSQKTLDALAKGREKGRLAIIERNKKIKEDKEANKITYNKPNSISSKLKTIEESIKKMTEMNNSKKEPIIINDVNGLETEKITQKKLEEDLIKQKKELDEQIKKRIVEDKKIEDEQAKRFVGTYNKHEYNTEDVKMAKPVKPIKMSKLPYNIKTVKSGIKR